jgi:hypothetical protein
MGPASGEYGFKNRQPRLHMTLRHITCPLSKEKFTIDLPSDITGASNFWPAKHWSWQGIQGPDNILIASEKGQCI